MKERRLDYRYMNGIVGQYQGKDVWVVQEKDFVVQMSKNDPDIVFAVVKKGEVWLQLVSGGMVIGEMSKEGEVVLYERSYFWGDPVEEKEPSPQTLVKDMSTSTSTSGEKVGKTVDDYLAGETLADKFLRQLQF